MSNGENVVTFRRSEPAATVGDSGDETTPRTQHQPLLSHGKLAHANAVRTALELEQILAALIRESDGGSRVIPRLRTAIKDLRTHLEVLKP